MGLSLAACGDAAALRIQLNWVAEPEFGGFYAAQANGHFAAAGLDVAIVEGGPGVPTPQLVATGKVEYAVVAAYQLLELNAKGGDLVALYAVFQGNPKGVMVHEAAPWRTLQELWQSDATISYEAGLADFAWLDRQYPGGKKQVVPYAANLAQFAADEAMAQQCFFTSEPIALALAGTPTRTFLIREAGFDPYDAILVTTRSRHLGDPGQSQRLVEALQLGWRDYLAAPAATHDELARRNPAMSRAAMDRAEQVQRPLLETDTTRQLGLGCMTKDRWQRTIDQLVELGRLPARLDAAQVFVWPSAVTPR